MQTKPLTPNKPDTEMEACEPLFTRMIAFANRQNRRTPTAPTDVGELDFHLETFAKHGAVVFKVYDNGNKYPATETEIRLWAALTSQSTQLFLCLQQLEREVKARYAAEDRVSALTDENARLLDLIDGLYRKYNTELDDADTALAQAARLALETPATSGEGDGE